MTRDEWDILAAEYALGTLDEKDRAAVEQMLAADPSRLRSVEDWQRRLSSMLGDEPPVAPSAGVWSKIDAALDSGGAVTVRAGEGAWKEMSRGVDKKILFAEPGRDCVSFLLRIHPGGCLPAHVHNRREECMMLEGDVRIGELRFAAGDYHVIPAAMPHPEVTSETGALIFVRSEPGVAATATSLR